MQGNQEGGGGAYDDMVLDGSTHYTYAADENEQSAAATDGPQTQMFSLPTEGNEPYQFFDHTGMGEDPNSASTDSIHESSHSNPARYPRHHQQPMSPPHSQDDACWLVTDTVVEATLRVSILLLQIAFCGKPNALTNLFMF